MNCQHFGEQLYEYVEGSFGPQTSAAAEEHVAICARCRELVSREQRASRLLSTHLKGAVAKLKLAPEVTNRVLRTLERERLTKAGKPSVGWWPKWLRWRVAAAFGLLAGLVAIGIWIRNGTGNTNVASVPNRA